MTNFRVINKIQYMNQSIMDAVILIPPTSTLVEKKTFKPDSQKILKSLTKLNI